MSIVRRIRSVAPRVMARGRLVWILSLAAVTLLCIFWILRTSPPRSVQAPEYSAAQDEYEENPAALAEYHRAIRASEDGQIDYPVAYRQTEWAKAITTAKAADPSMVLTHRGPGNVGGRTFALLVDPDDSLRTWWAGAAGGGLWKTTDAGKTWLPQTDQLPVMGITALAMSKRNPDIIYMGTGDGFGATGAIGGDGIFKSVDRGASWQHLSSTSRNSDFRHVNRLIVDPEDPNMLLASTGAGIFRSTDGGGQWSAVYTRAVEDLEARPGDFQHQLATVNGSGIVYSDDAGRSWNDATANWSQSFGRIELAYAPSAPDTVYASVAGQWWNQLYVSYDGGLHWEEAVQSGSDAPRTWMFRQGWLHNSLGVHPYDPTRLLLGGVLFKQGHVPNARRTLVGPVEFLRGGTQAWLGFAVLEDGGTHFNNTVAYRWSKARNLAQSDYVSLEIRFGQGSQKAHRFWVPENAGPENNGGRNVSLGQHRYGGYVDVPFQVWDTDNGRQLMVSFRDQNDNGRFDLIEFNRGYPGLARDRISREYLYIHKYAYHADTPQSEIAQDGGMVDGLLYYMWPYLRSGATWNPNNLPAQTLRVTHESRQVPRLEVILHSGHFVHVDHLDIVTINTNPAQGDFLILDANDGGVGMSEDHGKYFTEFDEPGAGLNTMQLYDADKQPGSSVYLAAGQDNGNWVSGNDPDGQAAWTKVTTADGMEAFWHPYRPDSVLISTQFNKVYRSTNGGESWNEVLSQVPWGSFLTSLSASVTAPESVYTITREGVWRSTNFGSNWSLVRIRTNLWGSGSTGRIRVSDADPAVVWAGFGMDNSPRQRLHVSTNAGRTWTMAALPENDAAPNTVISGLALHPTDASTAYALFSRRGRSKILRTTNMGRSWTDLSGFDGSGVSRNGFPDVAVHDLLVWPADENRIWVGTDIGLFESMDGGNSWHYADYGLPAVAIWRLKYRDGRILVATHGRGLWTTEPRALEFGPDRPTVVQVIEGHPMTPVRLPAAFWGEGAVSYALSPELPAGLTFDSATRVLSGTVSTFAAPVTYTYTATDRSGATVSHTFTLEVRKWSQVQIIYSVSGTPVDILVHNILVAEDYDSPSVTGFNVVAAGANSLNVREANTEHGTPLYSMPLTLAPHKRQTILLYGSDNELRMAVREHPDSGTHTPGEVPVYVAHGTAGLGAVDVHVVDNTDNRTVLWDLASNLPEGAMSAVSSLPPADYNVKRTVHTGGVVQEDVFRVEFSKYPDILVVLVVAPTVKLFAADDLGRWIDTRVVTSTDATTKLPDEPLELIGNYPNPFHVSTQVQFSLAQSAQVRIEVLDMLGRTVLVIPEGEFGPGINHVIPIAAGQLAAGSYFYRVHARAAAVERVVTGQMMLVR